MGSKQNWAGASGQFYEYEVYDLNTNWNDIGGNYIFARAIGSGWTAIYIGQTDSFKDRMPDHEKWPCARKNGVTHIHAHVNKDEGGRLNEESDLIGKHSPPCNIQGT